MSEQYHVEDYATPVTLEFGDVVQFPSLALDGVFIEWETKYVVMNVLSKGFYTGQIVEGQGLDDVGLTTPSTSWTPVRKTGERWTLAEMAIAFERQHGDPPGTFERFYGAAATNGAVTYPQHSIDQWFPRD